MPEPKPAVRQAMAAEAAAISELALRSKAHWGYSAEFIEACREELTVTPAQLDDPQRYYGLAELDGQLLGYYGIVGLGGGEFELDALFVEPEHIGRGVGRLLMAEACLQALSFGGLTMIIQGDPHAEAFYLAAGAVSIGSRPSESIPGRLLPLFRLTLESVS